MRILTAAAVAVAALVIGTAPLAQQPSPATSLERPFAAGGRISMDLSAGEYVLSGSPDGRIRMAWSTDDPADLSRVHNGVDIRGNEAAVTTYGPRNNFDVRIEVPARSNLHIRLTAGEMQITGIEGDKDVELHAGELDIDVGRADDYQRVDAGVWAGELHADAFRIVKEGLFRSFDWEGKGRYRLHAHLKAGEMRLHASAR